MHNFHRCLNLLSMPNMSLRSKHKKQRQIMQIYCRRLCTTRVPNRNSVARICVKLRPTVGNYAQLFSYCVELWGVYRARNCAQVKFTCIENSICSLLNWLKRNFKGPFTYLGISWSTKQLISCWWVLVLLFKDILGRRKAREIESGSYIPLQKFEK